MSHPAPPPVKKTILIVDDEKNTREGLRGSLEENYEVYVAADQVGAQAVMETEAVDLLLTDLRLGAESGMDLLDWALRESVAPTVIIMTAYGTVDAAVEAMKRGAYDFVTKPVNIDRLELLIKRALHGSEIERENVQLREQIDKRFGLESFVGDSPAMTEALDVIRQVT
jgi:DNA-binding NtrC family response regulator